MMHLRMTVAVLVYTLGTSPRCAGQF
jgi:hypothetical protein